MAENKITTVSGLKNTDSLKKVDLSNFIFI